MKRHFDDKNVSCIIDKQIARAGVIEATIERKIWHGNVNSMCIRLFTINNSTTSNEQARQANLI